MNGWDMPTQTAGLVQCANTDNGGVISTREPFASTDSTQSSYNCPQQPALIDEPARGMISKLPGYITITSGPEEATSADMSCPANATYLPSIPHQYPQVLLPRSFSLWALCITNANISDVQMKQRMADLFQVLAMSILHP